MYSFYLLKQLILTLDSNIWIKTNFLLGAVRQQVQIKIPGSLGINTM